MRRSILIFILLVTIFLACSPENNESQLKINDIKSLMMKVCDWQLANLPDTVVKSNGMTEPITGTSWHRGAFLTGVMALYNTVQDEKYLNAAIKICEENEWKLGQRIRHADDQCIGQTYIDIYRLKKDKKMIENTIQILDKIVEEPMFGTKVGWEKDKNWSWCDALYMAPPVYAKLSQSLDDLKYIDIMNKMWWLTTDHLYDKSEHLYYRDERYKIKPDGTGRRAKNGQKIFWGRGNGWVMGGIARVLNSMPKNYPDRERYVTLFKQMAERVSGLQSEDGLWRSSLLDYKEFPAPETSSSGFFCYALAWGINNEILVKDKYLPIVFKAWKGLVGVVDSSGKLGWVQLVGHDPTSVSKDDTMEYGVGAFLLAGSEIIKLLE